MLLLDGKSKQKIRLHLQYHLEEGLNKLNAFMVPSHLCGLFNWVGCDTKRKKDRIEWFGVMDCDQ